ncbi:MAG: integral rane sensor signal transduction histidine kinase [Rhizobacter sp.]|nr:integral rane sensor signal transduction histidine kinase [Rhizobacter sp.]
MNASLRRRLYVWLSASILVAGMLAAALSFWLSFRDANELQDAQLDQVAALLENGSLPLTSAQFVPKNNEDAETHFVVKLLGSPTLDLNPNLDVALPLTLKDGLQSIEQSGVGWRVTVSENISGQRFAVAQRMTVRDEAARDAALTTLLPLVVMVPVLLLIVGIVVKQTFAPLTAMSAEVDRVDGNQLAAIEERHAPLEALPLVQAVNRLLRRLGLVLDQQRRLVSDAAHELRTPVATLLVQADNVLHVALSPEATLRMASLRQGLARMSALLDQLLNFARVQGTGPSTRQLIALDSLARTAIEEMLPMAQAKGVDLGCVRFDPAHIQGDPLHAYALVRNAVDNAVRYTPAGGAVDVSISVEREEACLVVEDTGPGIGKADLERVFEPFVRVLGSNESGSGLGLAIARAAAQALGGSIELAERNDHRTGLRFVYRQATA